MKKVECPRCKGAGKVEDFESKDELMTWAEKMKKLKEQEIAEDQAEARRLKRLRAI